ncbi:hypothetical protein [Novosphingobium sp. B1]|uniref:hypothetical protein n=1 Tax=Novosphingobium sp. B1 TaxID=1938756 RepID=UPI0009D7D8F2|nr:hypothetical protein [Novosphingobium sp. B1]SMC77794.1 hypothetical protein SAMN06272759_1072 [Novosphingobium sp. B1]
MSRFKDENFLTRLVQAVNADAQFGAATEWFDGSVLLDDGSANCWLKIYNGAIIDRRPHMPPIGYTFKISAPGWAWDELVGGTPFTDLLMGGKRRFASPEDIVDGANMTPGIFAIEGDMMTAFRVIEAIYLMTDHYRETARSLEAAS